MTGTLGSYEVAVNGGTDRTHSYRSVQCPSQREYSRYPEDRYQETIGIFNKACIPLLTILQEIDFPPCLRQMVGLKDRNCLPQNFLNILPCL